MDISHLRVEYRQRPLRREDLHDNPWEQFQLWLEEAVRVEEIEPNAMQLATVDKNGHPSSRTVLLKLIDQGFVFFTNLNSRKAEQMLATPWAAATFWWRQLERQVTLEGSVEPVSREIAAVYFANRPRPSQLASWASTNQSAPLTSREELEKNYKQREEEFRGREVPLPPFWGGFRLIPHRFEFWQGRPNRLHDRFLYIKENERWTLQRLVP